MATSAPGYGYQVLTPTASTALTIPAGAWSAIVSVETNSIRWTVEGTTPTSTVGVLIPAGEEREFVGRETLQQLLIIDASGASSVKVAYFPRLAP